MELKIINKKEEPLLSRTMVEAEITFEKTTPSGREVKSRLAKDLGKDEKLIVVKGIHTYLGSKKAKNLSYVYENEESLKRIEPRTKEKAGKNKGESEAEEKPQEHDKKEEAKGELKKEAKQEEQKPQEKTEATKEKK